MLYKSWLDNVTRLYAAEADGIAKLLGLGFTPGIGGSYATATTCAPSIDGTAVALAAFGEMDGVITAGAVVTAYSRDSIDFATASESGGPLAAGDYTVYADVAESAGPAKYYLLKPMAMLTTAFADLSGYLALATVHWDGTDTLSSLVDLRAGKWGVLDLTNLGSGDRTEIVVGSSRDWRFAGDVQVDGRLTAKAYLDVGVSGVGGGLVTLYGTTESPTDLVIGVAEGIVSGQLYLHPAESGGSIWIVLGENGLLDVPATASIWVEGGCEIKDGGQLLVHDGGSATLKDGSETTIKSDAVVLHESGDFISKPAKNQFTGAAPLKAWARVVGATGALTSFFNVDSVTRNSAGSYTVNLKRGFAAAADNIPTVQLVNNGSHYWIAMGVIDTDSVSFVVMDGTNPADCDFAIHIAGGDQEDDPA